MRIIYVCEEEEKEVGRKKASGACPYCGGTVEAVDIEGKGKLFCLPICLRFKIKYICSLCSRRPCFVPLIHFGQISIQTSSFASLWSFVFFSIDVGRINI
uniref:Putative ovule protein n=1 Tax=Solanum chacoense TaxID=4108 RepID=A0A0V0GX82_SOLCH